MIAAVVVCISHVISDRISPSLSRTLFLSWPILRCLNYLDNALIILTLLCVG